MEEEIHLGLLDNPGRSPGEYVFRAFYIAGIEER
jgi:hypothetical protein